MNYYAQGYVSSRLFNDIAIAIIPGQTMKRSKKTRSMDDPYFLKVMFLEEYSRASLY